MTKLKLAVFFILMITVLSFLAGSVISENLTSMCSEDSLPNDFLVSLVLNHFSDGIVPQTGENIRVTAYSVMRAESDGAPAGCGDIDKPDAGDMSVGLWQINNHYSGYNLLDLFDPDFNAEAARVLSKDGTDWNLWCSYEKTACGGKGDKNYQKFLIQARDIFSQPQTVACYSNADCEDTTMSDAYCSSDLKSVLQKKTSYTCKNPGKENARCVSAEQNVLLKKCEKNTACLSGSCQPVTQPTCSDSDGLNYNNKGIVQVGNNDYTDYCDGNKKLVEYYCEKNTARSKIVKCGCNNSACID